MREVLPTAKLPVRIIFFVIVLINDGTAPCLVGYCCRAKIHLSWVKIFKNFP